MLTNCECLDFRFIAFKICKLSGKALEQNMEFKNFFAYLSCKNEKVFVGLKIL